MNLESDDHRSDAYGPASGIAGLYEPSIASSASSSQLSIFSDSLSVQSSIASSISDDFRLTQEDARERDRICAHAQLRYHAQNHAPSEEPSAIGRLITEKFTQSTLTYAHVTTQPRQNPRRTSSSKCPHPPPLVRQQDRKVNFVDNLVDSAAQMVEVIWPLSTVPCSTTSGGGRSVLPLRTYIEETLRRSRTSYSTLQVALYYLLLIKPHVPKGDFTMEQKSDCAAARALMCGRRMFLAALILASKYLQDRNYSAKAWSKMSGLRVNEINANERIFLEKINWKLHIPKPTFETWQEVVLRYTPQPSGCPAGPVAANTPTWKSIIPHLNPELDYMLCSSNRPMTVTPSPTPSYLTSPVTPSPIRSSLSVVRLEEPTSQESTPTPATILPRYLEPRPSIAPPTPLLARMGPLPTPQMTPSSVASSTPAVSTCNSRRPSMCSAMATAQRMSLNRCILDVCPAASAEFRDAPSRRPSLMSSSSGSSPEPLLSDHTTSSRASSVSSSISTLSTTSSLAPQRTSLARLATCRNVRLPPPDLHLREPTVEEGSESKPILIDDDVEMVSSPDLADFSISDRALHAPHRHSKHAPHHSLPVASAAAAAADKSARKRCRSRGHHRRSELQEEVRYLLQESIDDDDDDEADDTMDVDDHILPSPTPAVGYATHLLAKSLTHHMREAQPHAATAAPALARRDSVYHRVPVRSCDGKKRTCVMGADPSSTTSYARVRG